MVHTTTWENFQCIFLSERRQNRVAICCVIPFYMTDTPKKAKVQRRKQISAFQGLGMGGEIIHKGVTLVLGVDEIVLQGTLVVDT